MIFEITNRPESDQHFVARPVKSFGVLDGGPKLLTTSATPSMRNVSRPNLLFLPVVTACFVCVAANAADLPNFVFIQSEGQGFASTSVQIDPTEPASKSESFSTLNLQRLAREGVRFSRVYAPSPRCTPSRATYSTGISPARLAMTFTSSGVDTGHALIEPPVVSELPRDVTTIAEMLTSARYAAAHFGKWPVGLADPKVHEAIRRHPLGFDQRKNAIENGRISRSNGQRR